MGKKRSIQIQLQQFPEELRQWIKTAVIGLWPPEMQDHYQACLVKQVWETYQRYIPKDQTAQGVKEPWEVQEPQEAQEPREPREPQKPQDSDHAVNLTLKELGDAKDVRERFLKEIERDAEYKKAELWYVPMALSVFFMITGGLSVAGGIRYFPELHNWQTAGKLLSDAFHTGEGWQEASRWLYTIINGSWQETLLFWMAGSAAAVMICWILAYDLKRRYDKGQKMFMKRWRNILGVMVTAFFLTACTVERQEEELYVYNLMAKDWEVPMMTVEHGEDGIIVWEDPGMEARVRLWVEKPDGDIHYSDVWDIRYISIHPTGDTVLKVPGEGDSFQLRNDRINRPKVKGTEKWQNLPPVRSLRDLRHFENLQILDMDAIVTERLTDISGPETCPNLSVLILAGYIKPENLEPLSECSSLEYLELRMDGELDLTPLKELKNLTRLIVALGDIPSLEPLTDLPLECLVLRGDDDWREDGRNGDESSDSEHRGGEHSDDEHSRNTKTPDFSPLAEMEELRYLIISDISSFGCDDCEYLKGLEKLETLEIIKTEASYKANEVRRMLPQLKRFNSRL